MGLTLKPLLEGSYRIDDDAIPFPDSGHTPPTTRNVFMIFLFHQSRIKLLILIFKLFLNICFWNRIIFW